MRTHLTFHDEPDDDMTIKMSMRTRHTAHGQPDDEDKNEDEAAESGHASLLMTNHKTKIT